LKAGAQLGPEPLTGAVFYQETGVFEPGVTKRLMSPADNGTGVFFVP
tara:strand:- start:626 stop:766 length:141 start_codon:yes stop_codon:yes gene_type:complete